jgi:hypothetical protein
MSKHGSVTEFIQHKTLQNGKVGNLTLTTLVVSILHLSQNIFFGSIPKGVSRPSCTFVTRVVKFSSALVFISWNPEQSSPLSSFFNKLCQLELFLSPVDSKIELLNFFARSKTVSSSLSLSESEISFSSSPKFFSMSLIRTLDCLLCLGLEVESNLRNLKGLEAGKFENGDKTESILNDEYLGVGHFVLGFDELV